MKIFSFVDLPSADLVVDAIYEGGANNDLSDDPLSRLMRCGNQGGFRKVGRSSTRYVILYSSLADREWPDHLDPATGLFTYYGDNKTAGSELHDTTQGGNRLLARTFGKVHSSQAHRAEGPAFFVFTKAAPLYGSRAVQFRGLAAPGADGVAPTDDLVAVWKSTRGQRFQNYKATFTILDTPRISRAWLDDLRSGEGLGENCPEVWRWWVQYGRYVPLAATPAADIRGREEQLPVTELEKAIVACIYYYFKDNATAFEACAAALVRFLDPENYVVDEVTRRSVDGGRDAIGYYRLGPPSDPITVDFALEAKCYRPALPGRTDRPLGVGVEQTSRLISRLRHRQFGVLVTTSYVRHQAYREIREDGHPVILLCGRDLAKLLIDKGYSSVEAVSEWLRQFPV